MGIVSDGEELARYLSEPTMVEDGEITPAAFSLVTLPKSGRAEDYVSVVRCALKRPKWSGLKKMRPRGNDIGYIGFALFNAGACKKVACNGFCVKRIIVPEPTPEKAYHAGLVYGDGEKELAGECRNPDYLEFLMEITMITTFVRLKPCPKA